MNPSARPRLPEPGLPFPENTEASRKNNKVVPRNYWDFCPNCSARLENQGCKYRCPRCTYFMSCSDYD